MKKNVSLSRKAAFLTSVSCLALSLIGNRAYAFEYQTSGGIDIRLDNSFEYSVLERTAPVSSYLASQPNSNDGDNNLRAGIVSNRVQLLTQFSASYKGFGFATSALSYYDSVYNQNTQNHDSLTYNAANEPPSKFTQATRTQAGRDIKLRDLFVYGSEDISGVPVTVRVGRFVNLFGESLLFPLNGISYGQAPIDVQQAFSVPNSQAKDLFLPVGQALVTIQPTQSLSVSAYYQFEWEPFNFPPSGSYFNAYTDAGIEGGERAIAAPVGTPGFPPNTAGYFYRGRDQSGADTGQFGMAIHYDPITLPVDLGFYALQYNDTEPQVYLHQSAVPAFIPGVPGMPNALKLGTYQLVYPDHIQIYGASFSNTVGALNIAGEVSARVNEPLESASPGLPAVLVPAGVNANNSSNPLYATGNTLHYQASAIYLGPSTPLWNASTVYFEAAGDNLIGFDKNRENFNTHYRHMALGFRTLAIVNYYQVLPGIDINPSVGFGWNFMGLAPDTPAFNDTGIDRGGDITIGLQAVYKNTWTGNIGYTNYISPPGRDPLADRDYAFFNVQRTF